MSESENNPAMDVVKPYPLSRVVLGRVVLAALVVIFADWMAAPLLGVIAVAGFLWALRSLRKAPAAFRAGAIKTAIYAVAAVIAFFVHGAAQSNDRAQGDLLVGKLEQYKQAHQAYPEKLQELAPALLPQIPRARFSPFVYASSPDGTYFLTYINLPPGGRCTYRSQAKAWKCEAD